MFIENGDGYCRPVVTFYWPVIEDGNVFRRVATWTEYLESLGKGISHEEAVQNYLYETFYAFCEGTGRL